MSDKDTIQISSDEYKHLKHAEETLDFLEGTFYVLHKKIKQLLDDYEALIT